LFLPSSASGPEAVADAIPGAKLAEFPAGVGPALYLGDYDAILDEIQEFLTGDRPPPVAQDRVFAALLFTDIVGSTEKTTELGDRRWRELLDRHDALVRSTLARFGGRWVNPTGDGLLATFDGPARAVHCAEAIATGLRTHGLAVRAGLHAGEVERRGEDVAGIAVNIARRVCDAAQPEELLVSRTVTDLVAGSGLEFDDRGEHELKGVPGRWQLFAVKA
jgi:class 3 adenylate cyclase